MSSLPKRRILLNGFIVWTFWVLFYIILFRIQTGRSWGATIISAATTNYTFAVLSIAIWYICRGIPFGKIHFVPLLLIHFILANVFSALWLLIIYGSWYLQVGDEMFTVVPLREIIGWQYLLGVIIYLLNAGIFYMLIYYRQFREKELAEKELKILSRDAELQALKMQIHPHFLFNALNSINALIKEQPDLARKMMGKLSDLLRFSLETREKPLIPLKEEIDLMHQYLEIEKVRFSDRIVIEEQIEPGLETWRVPAMILQPLLENSVRHGIAARRGNGWIRINIDSNDDLLRITVANSVASGGSKQNDGAGSTGTGLENIRQRLHLLYQDNCTFSIQPGPDVFTVAISLPQEKA